MVMIVDENSNKKREEKKQINVSEKRQITIPKRFYDRLGIGQEVVCELRGNEIVLRGVPKVEDFSEEILKDLVEKGFNNQELIREFQKTRTQIRPAVERLITESKQAAESLNSNGDKQTEEIFGDLKE